MAAWKFIFFFQSATDKTFKKTIDKEKPTWMLSDALIGRQHCSALTFLFLQGASTVGWRHWEIFCSCSCIAVGTFPMTHGMLLVETTNKHHCSKRYLTRWGRLNALPSFWSSSKIRESGMMEYILMAHSWIPPPATHIWVVYLKFKATCKTILGGCHVLRGVLGWNSQTHAVSFISVFGRLVLLHFNLASTCKKKP